MNVHGALARNSSPIHSNPSQIEKPMAFAIYDGEGGGVEVTAIGQITPDTPKAFSDYLKLMAQKNLKIQALWFNSLGGNLGAALALGRMMRADRIASVLDGACLSACAYAFLGGTRRYISFVNRQPNGPTASTRIGFHQFDGPQAAGSINTVKKAQIFGTVLTGETQLTFSDLAKYVADMGVDAQILRIASAASPDEMVYPDMQTLLDLRVALGDDQSWSIQLIANGEHLRAIGIANDPEFRWQMTFECFSHDNAALRPAVILTKPKVALQLSDYPAVIDDLHAVREISARDYRVHPEQYFGITEGETIGDVHLFVEGATSNLFGSNNSYLLADDRWAHILVYPSPGLVDDILRVGKVSAQVDFTEDGEDGYWGSALDMSQRERSAVTVAWRDCRRPK
jgi:hypothetical protein